MAVDESGRAKVFFSLEPGEDGYPPATAESLWAEPLAPNMARIDNIPFFAVGVALGDVVQVRRDEEGLAWFVRVVKSGGRGTVRLLVFREDDVPQIRQAVADRGFKLEQSHLPRLFAVDVANAAQLAELRRFIAAVGAERIDYEEACLPDEAADGSRNDG